MPLSFYVLSGSPFAWRVWLALEHKRIPYALRLLSMNEGDLRKAEFLALNPRGKVPVIVDDGFVLYESSAILDYLDAAYPQAPLLTPADPRGRALAKRIAAEADAYLYPPLRALLFQTLMRKEGEPDASIVEEAKANVARELAFFEGAFAGAFVTGEAPGLADFTLYPMTALLQRIAEKAPRLGTDALLSEGAKKWMRHVEALPYFASTIPPHWRA